MKKKCGPGNPAYDACGNYCRKDIHAGTDPAGNDAAAAEAGEHLPEPAGLAAPLAMRRSGDRTPRPDQPSSRTSYSY